VNWGLSYIPCLFYQMGKPVCYGMMSEKLNGCLFCILAGWVKGMISKIGFMSIIKKKKIGFMSIEDELLSPLR
jgi:hypothetical protein